MSVNQIDTNTNMGFRSLGDRKLYPQTKTRLTMKLGFDNED